MKINNKIKNNKPTRRENNMKHFIQIICVFTLIAGFVFDSVKSIQVPFDDFQQDYAFM